MTLCIAAEGWIDNERCIVFCCDTRAERGGIFHELVGSDDAWKIRVIGKNIALLSGAETPADRLLALCDKTISDFGTQPAGDDSELFVDRFMRDLESHAGKRKQDLVEQWVQFNLAMPFDEFRKTHREQLHPEHAKELWRRIQDIDLEADILLCGFQDDLPAIVKLNRYGKAHWENNYAAVGAGADIAYSFLALRDWDTDPTAMQCAYYLMEAKIAAEQNRHVGPQTRIQLITSDRRRFSFKEQTFDDLRDKILEQWKVPELSFSFDMLEEASSTEADSGSVEKPENAK